MAKDDRRKPQKATSAGHGAKSEAVREAAILALLSEKTLGDAARVSGVAEKTIRRWLADDAVFKAEYAEARRVTFQAGMSRIQALVGKAVDTLDGLLDSTSDTARLGAARAITDLGMHQQDSENILQKLDEIEERLGKG